MRRWVGAAIAFVGVMGIAVALTAVLVSLPVPAAGGTCGPGRSSESAAAAFFNPASIGAGAEPPASAGAAPRLEWLAFIGECQSATDARMLAGLGILVLALGAATVGILMLVRKPAAAPTESTTAAAPPGWYPNPDESSSGYRWWDGRQWGPSSTPPGSPAY